MLANSENGKVEICINGEWGEICPYNWEEDTYWELSEALVTCRQLGFNCKF